MKTPHDLRQGNIRQALLCAMCLLACAAPAVADPKPLTKEEQAKIDAAIDKGVAFLKRSQKKEGDWPRHWPTTYVVAQTALPAYALLESGVAVDDPVIQKAAKFLRRIALKTPFTYEISLALLFFDRLGDPQDEKLIQSLALRLIAGQYRTGGWSYRNLPLSEKYEDPLLKTLKELSERMDRNKSTAEALKEFDVPRSFRHLTVFQDLRGFDWQEIGDGDHIRGTTPFVGLTDNSNTQFAILGLWAAHRHGVPTMPTFRLVVERFERSQVPDGRWLYSGGYNGASAASLVSARRSMTCVGLIALAVGRGAKLPSPGFPPADREDLAILRGLTALAKGIGLPNGSMAKRVPQEDLYFLWSLERVGVLYNLTTIGDKDWYRWGAEILIANQLSNGSWPGTSLQREATRVLLDYGAVFNTAFALLFLKRSHPMKDLTAKLPFKPKELNQGIARLMRGEPFPERPVAIPSPRKDRNP